MSKKSVNRRDFLRLSATVGAGTLLIPDATASTINNTTYSAKNESKIPVRTLGKTGIKLPILSMGVMRADNPNLLRAAYNSGIFHFDTAHVYQNGKNEEMVGAFFEDKPRDSFFIATKAKFKYPLEDNFEQVFNETFETSLKRLKMDYVDIFYAHALESVGEVNDPRVIEALKKIKASGKAKFIGFSTHAHKPEQIDAAIETGIYDVGLISYNFKLNNIKETDEAIERAVKAGIGLVAMKTMTGGKEDADGKKKIDAKACLKWAWNNPNITTAIPGFTNYDELDDCIAAAENPTITSEDKAYLAALREEEMLFCQQCETCKSQCPKALPIPDIMRAYMYTYGYENAQRSKETLQELDLAQNVCADCDTCLVDCPSGFDVARKIAAIIPVAQIPDEFLS